MELLLNVMLWHAAFIATGAVAACVIPALLRRREVAYFESACLAQPEDHATCNKREDNTTDVAANASSNICGSFSAQLSACSYAVYPVPFFCPHRVEAATRLIFDPQCRGCLFVADCTDSGKCLILYTAVVCVCAVTLALVPLISLIADHLYRLQLAKQSHRSVKAVYPDQAPNSLV